MKKFNPITPSRRQYSVLDFSGLSKKKPERGLIRKYSKSGGRNNLGRETDINMGGGHKRRYRIVDFKRDKIGIPGKVAALEYDPNRTANIALIHYVDGEKRYIIAPNGLAVGTMVSSGPNAEIATGNALPLRNIPVGQSIHNIELKLGRGGQLVRSAGGAAQLMAKEGDYAQVKMPSGEVRQILLDCFATIGQIGNIELRNIEIGKAGRSRWMGRRPHNRGVTKNPVDHPMGGGEGKTSGGRHPCSPTGVKAKGFRTRKNKRTQKFIVKTRHSKGK